MKTHRRLRSVRKRSTASAPRHSSGIFLFAARSFIVGHVCASAAAKLANEIVSLTVLVSSSASTPTPFVVTVLKVRHAQTNKQNKTKQAVFQHQSPS
jgi:uncharacterized membrane protein